MLEIKNRLKQCFNYLPRKNRFLIVPLIAFNMAAVNVHAQEIVTYDIPASTLDKVLSQFASESGVSLSSESKGIKGKSSQGLKGQYTLEQGLNTLFEGSDISWELAENNTLLLATENKTPGVIRLETINVEGDSVGNSAESSILRKRDAPNAITSIEAGQLNQFGDQPLGDALRRLPGVTFGDANRAREVQLRAIGSQYTQVLANNRALADGSSSRSVQVDRIPSSLVERVEITRAPLASQDGQGAAGTLNIVWKNTDFTPRTEVGVGAGYLEDTARVGDVTILHAGESGDFRYALLGGIQRQHRNENEDVYEFEGDGTADGGSLEINERTFNQINLVPAFEFDLGQKNMLRFEPSYLYTEEIRYNPISKLEDDQLSVSEVKVKLRERVRENVGLLSSWNHQLSSESDFTFSIDAQKGSENTERDETKFKPVGTFDSQTLRSQRKEFSRLSPSIRFDHYIGDHDLSWGGDFSQSKREESDIKNGVSTDTSTFKIQEDRWNAFAQNIWQINDQMILTSGLRLEQSSTKTTDFAGNSETKSSVFALPSLHIVRTIGEQTDIRLGIARTLRRAGLGDLSPTLSNESGTLADPDTGGNPELNPESIWGLDTGVDHYFYQGAGLASVNLFARKFTDKIENISALENARYVSRPQNIGDGRLFGIELEGRLPMTIIDFPNLTLWGNATYIDSEVDTSAGETRRFLEQHDAVANIGLDWYVAPWNSTFSISTNWVSGYDQTVKNNDGSSTNTVLTSLTRLDMSARTELSKDVSLNLSLLNLLAPSQTQTDKVFMDDGTLDSRSKATEVTYRSIYLRLNWKF
jgi:iron complex outermembrane receptor protein